MKSFLLRILFANFELLINIIETYYNNLRKIDTVFAKAIFFHIYKSNSISVKTLHFFASNVAFTLRAITINTVTSKLNRYAN